jgi:putative transposase
MPFPEAPLHGVIVDRTRSRYRFFEAEYAYFVTATIVGWLPRFTRPEAVEIVYDSWRSLQQNHGLEIDAGCHAHRLGVGMSSPLQSPRHRRQVEAKADDLSGVMQKFKSFTARSLR